MPQRIPEESLPEPRRMEIFMALVEAQDQEMSVPQSRRYISERYGITESQLRSIEQEGLERQWPPL